MTEIEKLINLRTKLRTRYRECTSVSKRLLIVKMGKVVNSQIERIEREDPEIVRIQDAFDLNSDT